MTDSNMIKECQYCGEVLPQLRSDAKYCSSKCRNDFNNLQKLNAAQEHEAIVGEAHAILWKNRNILLKYIDQTVEMTVLKALGFNFAYLIESRNIEGKTHYGYYDVWIYSEKENQIKIYKK